MNSIKITLYKGIKLLLLALVLLSAKSNAQVVPFGFIDSKIEAVSTIEEVEVEGIIWSKNNLDLTKYRNGDDIPQIIDAATWIALTTGGWCYYNFTETDIAGRGKYYNGFAVLDERGLAPDGWHIPTQAEYLNFQTIIDVYKLRATSTWTDNLGTDNYGFGLKLSGKVNNSGGWSLLNAGIEASFLWTSHLETGQKLKYMIFISNSSTISTPLPSNASRNWGMPVRLIKGGL